jgi:hypothetical protein
VVGGVARVEDDVAHVVSWRAVREPLERRRRRWRCRLFG